MAFRQLSSSVKQVLRWTGLMPVFSSLDRVRCALIKTWCRRTGRNPLEYIYNNSFFSVARHEYVLKNTPQALAEAVYHFFRPKSVIDFGCGCGIYLREFERLGVEIFGIDGSPAAMRNLAIPQERFTLSDLTKKISVPKRYDCAICFEVAEHIPASASGTLVDNVTAGSDLVVFTAARKGQGGHDHINEQNPEFWGSLFERRGYCYLAPETDALKAELQRAEAIFWLVDNLMVFKKK